MIRVGRRARRLAQLCDQEHGDRVSKKVDGGSATGPLQAPTRERSGSWLLAPWRCGFADVPACARDQQRSGASPESARRCAI